MLKRLLQNHALANLTFVLVLVMGYFAYQDMPREQDPSINLNWVNITTALPGASAADVETQVTEPLEEALEKVSDIRFISSSSLQDVSNILVRFDEIDDATFRSRLADIRREVQVQLDELPKDADQPDIVEINTGNAFPTALVIVTGLADDETLRKQADRITQDLDRMPGVWRAKALAENDPELQVLFSPEKLVGLGISPAALADTVQAYFRDVAAGDIEIGERSWQIRVEGTANDPQYLSDLPILTADGEVPLRAVADVVRGRTEASEIVRYQGQPASLIYVAKKASANTLDIVDNIQLYISDRNALEHKTGVRLVLLDDRTSLIKESLDVMERNALYGLALVISVTWLFLGLKISFFTTIGIPFVLFGTFWFLDTAGQSLNVVVLLAIVISLGMLVDDAVVVVETIHHKVRNGLNTTSAAVETLREVAAPVTTAVLTTIAAFMPLMLMPGILGKFMFVVPLVVTTALVISLIEAFWILPSHLAASRLEHENASAAERIRQKLTGELRRRFTRTLIAALRKPKSTLLLGALPFALAIVAVSTGIVRTEFFASEPYRFFYINVLMPPGTSLSKTMETTFSVEAKVRAALPVKISDTIVSYAGHQFSETEPLVGARYGQVFVNLGPRTSDSPGVDAVIDGLREAVKGTPGPDTISFLRRTGGPPTTKPISIKVRGDDPDQVRAAADQLISILARHSAIHDVSDDDDKGRMELSLRMDPDAIVRAGLDPNMVLRAVRLFSDGEIAASMRYRGEKIDVRVRGRDQNLSAVDQFLHNTVSLSTGAEITIGNLLHAETNQSQSNIRHYNLRRAITVESNLDKEQLDTVQANRWISTEWRNHAANFPEVELDFSGELDDIQESLNAIAVLFLLGLGLIYLILGAQFRSYLQPLYIIASVPMAFSGVVFGLIISGYPLSMYTLYGVVALAGISVNSAIVLISTANRLTDRGFSTVRAAVFAARRRVIPVIVTSATTMAGLASLAFGFGGESLMWGPVATAIFWGLAFSTLLTLLMIPVIYAYLSKRPAESEEKLAPLPKVLKLSLRPADLLRYVAAMMHVGQRPEPGFDDILDNQTLSQQYHSAVSLVEREEYDHAIREFEDMARSQPGNGACNLYAAEVLVRFMLKHGWDIGYDARAKRFLTRAESLLETSARLSAVRRAYKRLAAESHSANQ